MNTKLIVVLLCSVLLSPLSFAKDSKLCPTELVKFWSGIAQSTTNADAIPRFLLDHHCLNVKGISTEFHDLTVKRLDNPESEEVLNAMLAQLNLNWASNPSIKR